MVEKQLKKDRYGGIELKDISILPNSELEFDGKLKAWIPEWKADGVRSVQIYFRAPKFHLMNTASAHGFFLHHARLDYVLMVLWLDEKVPCRMPAYASHYIGIGGCVLRLVDDREGCDLPFEVLMIKEFRTTDARKWKFPGGFVDPGEALERAVVREVREETGVDVEFLGLINLREQLNFKYGATDIYFTSVCFANHADINVEDTNEV
jgi:ADP-ribose pyrophosphatase YjhB (NUDIX family)